MTDKKISALTAATTPLVGTEVVPIVQGGVTVKVPVSDLTAGRDVNALSYSSTTGATFAMSSGAVGVGINPKTWNSVFKATEMARQGSAVAAQTNNNTINITSNAYFDSTGWKYGNTDTASYYTQYDGEHSWWSAESGTADTAISFTQRLVLRRAGDLICNTGNFIPNTAAKGINFTANTPAAGMTSQLLNWYEEGTWTPVITGSVSNPTLTMDGTYTGGRYTRVGSVVHITFEARWSAVSGGSGDVIITGLPFVRRNTTQPPGDFFVLNSRGITYSGDTLVSNIPSGSSSMYVSSNDPAGGAQYTLNVTGLGISSIGFLRGSGSYFI